MIEIQRRVQSAAESILDNEALTADLDDDAAKLLLDWGVGFARKIVGQTVEMNDAQAEDAIYQPMRSLRKMLRGANKWANGPGEKNLRRVLKEAPNVYGHGYTQPGEDEIDALMGQIPPTAPQRVMALKNFLEGKPYELTGDEEAAETPERESVRSSVGHKRIDR